MRASWPSRSPQCRSPWMSCGSSSGATSPHLPGGSRAMSLQPLPSIRSAEPDEEPEGGFRLPLYRRVLDVLVSVTALVAFFPIGLLIALATLVDSGMPIFYVQERVGLDRRKAERPRFKGKDRRRRAGYGGPIHV